MPSGLVRSGNFRNGTPLTLPHTFGTPVTLPEPQGNVNPQANSSLSSNPVTWAPSPAHFGNTVDLSLQTVGSIVVVAPGGTGTTNINLTQLLGAPTPTLTYSGAPAGVTLAFAPNPDTGTSVCTITVNASVAVGKYTITITGTSGSEVNYTNLHLVVAVAGGPIEATMVFTNSQVLGLKTTPILVIPAPGAGQVIQLLYAGWEFTPGSVPYTVSPGGSVSRPFLIYNNNPADFTLDAGITGVFVIENAVTIKQWYFSVSAPSNPWVSSQVINKAMYLADEGDYTTITGGTGSTLSLTIVYQIITAE